GRCHQGVGQALAVDVYGQVSLGYFQDLADQGVAIGGRARRGNGNQFVAGGHFRAINNLGFFDDTHTETGQVVIFAFVHARHFGSFTADQRSASLFAADTNTVDYIGRNINIQFAGRVIIEEEQRLNDGDYQIVHTHGHQINTD